jgi:23S rRNA (uracil1939-C5)-methyltransferase
VEACRLTGSERVLDAYCGSGLFSVFLSHRCASVMGIDGDPLAIRCARWNCRSGGARNALFQTGDLLQVLRRLPVRERRCDVVVLDPPRSGCGSALLGEIIALGVRRILYVSCHPATQARDVRLFLQGGFRLTGLQPVDMFPQTAHIEVVAALARD